MYILTLAHIRGSEKFSMQSTIVLHIRCICLIIYKMRYSIQGRYSSFTILTAFAICTAFFILVLNTQYMIPTLETHYEDA